MKLAQFEKHYKRALADLYAAEKQCLRRLPQMAAAASAPTLRDAFQEHLQETRQQVKRLERLMEKRHIRPLKESGVMSELLAEINTLLKEAWPRGQFLDAALSAAAQKIEGHEVTCYGCAHHCARLLGFYEDLRPLEESFHEERAMEEKVGRFAETVSLDTLEAEAA